MSLPRLLEAMWTGTKPCRFTRTNLLRPPAQSTVQQGRLSCRLLNSASINRPAPRVPDLHGFPVFRAQERRDFQQVQVSGTRQQRGGSERVGTSSAQHKGQAAVEGSKRLQHLPPPPRARAVPLPPVPQQSSLPKRIRNARHRPSSPASTLQHLQRRLRTPLGYALSQPSSSAPLVGRNVSSQKARARLWTCSRLSRKVRTCGTRRIRRYWGR